MGILTETCPAPECNVTTSEIEHWANEFKDYLEQFQPAFQRPEPWIWTKRYIQGLLGEAQRKNIEQMALELGENVRSMQYFFSQSPWKVEPILVVCQSCFDR
jgi:SRSO17 transposase